MNPQEFCYWLQGYCELGDPKNGMTAEQVEMIKRHLDLVFVKVTDKPKISRPNYPDTLDLSGGPRYC